MQDQFALGNGLRQALLQFEQPITDGIEGMVVERVSAATGTLGLLHGGIGVP